LLLDRPGLRPKRSQFSQFPRRPLARRPVSPSLKDLRDFIPLCTIGGSPFHAVQAVCRLRPRLLCNATVAPLGFWATSRCGRGADPAAGGDTVTNSMAIVPTTTGSVSVFPSALTHLVL
jgi:hypothetical protein